MIQADNGSLAHLENVEYMPNLDRTWTITVNEGMIIEIIFYEFSVEYRDSCNRDYVQVGKVWYYTGCDVVHIC